MTARLGYVCRHQLRKSRKMTGLREVKERKLGQLANEPLRNKFGCSSVTVLYQKLIFLEKG